jgi:N-acetylglutamate synthase-like GNAT family acetyltransferase
MGAPEVGQWQALNDLFKSVLDAFHPKSVAVFGCATGNGFEHIDPGLTARVVGIDINPIYLEVLQKRFDRKLPQLELREQDFSAADFAIAPVDLVFAALVFEYVPIDQAVFNISACLAPGGRLVAALQQPSPQSAPVTKTRFTSLEALGPIMSLVDPARFAQVCAQNGLVCEKTQTFPLKQGKSLFVGVYRKSAAPKSNGDEAGGGMTDQPVAIREASAGDAALLARLIRESFRDVAARFALTPANCPKHPSNCTPDWIESDWARGVQYFLLSQGDTCPGCVALERPRPGLCYLERLAVLPAWRRRGMGRALVRHVLARAREEGARQIGIGLIADHVELKRWYANLGFVETHTQRFQHLPFEVCFMRCDFHDC